MFERERDECVALLHAIADGRENGTRLPPAPDIDQRQQQVRVFFRSARLGLVFVIASVCDMARR